MSEKRRDNRNRILRSGESQRKDGRIENANTPYSRIIVADTGCGMTEEEFENRWMVIGTSNKLSLPYTPKGRKKAGKKGIGRFSVERLAEHAMIYSFTEKESFKVFLNWNLYEEISVAGLQQRIQILRNKNDVSAAKYIANQLEYYLSLMLEGDNKIEQQNVRKKVGRIIDDYEAAYEPAFLHLFEEQILPILKKQEEVELKLENIDNPLEQIRNKDDEETYNILFADDDLDVSIEYCGNIYYCEIRVTDYEGTKKRGPVVEGEKKKEWQKTGKVCEILYYYKKMDIIDLYIYPNEDEKKIVVLR